MPERPIVLATATKLLEKHGTDDRIKGRKGCRRAWIFGYLGLLLVFRAMPSTAGEKTHRPLNLLDFGAKLDCSTDDTAAWQAAIGAAAAAGGGEIDEPAGCSVVDGVTVTSAAGAVVLHGEGVDVSVVKAKTTLSTPFTTAGSHITIDGISFASRGQQTAGAYVHIGAGSIISLTHFVMTGGAHPIVIDDDTSSIFIDHGNFTDTLPGSATIEIDGGNDQFLSDLVSDNNPARQSGAGVLITRSGATWIENVDFIHSGNGLAFEPHPGSASQITWMFVQHSSFDSGNGCGVLIDIPNRAAARGLTFTDTWTSTNRDGVCLRGSGTIDGISFVNHRAFNNAQRGMIWQTGTDVSLDGGSQVSGNGSAGVEVGVGVSGWTIRNSRIGQTARFANSQRSSILLDGKNDDLAIQDNDLRGSTGPSIVMRGLPEPHSQIEGNLGFNPRGVRTVAPGPSPWTYKAGPSAENVSLTGGTVTSVSIAGVTIATQSPAFFRLVPNQSVLLTYLSPPNFVINAE